MFVVHLIFFGLFFQATSSGSGRHSLWLLTTHISGETPFPEYSAVVMLDDIQVAYYDSATNQLTMVGVGGKKLGEHEVLQQVFWAVESILYSSSKRLKLYKQRFNLTTGVHVQQVLTGCETLEEGVPAFVMFRDGFNGEDTDSLMYNTTHFTYKHNEAGIEWDTMKLMRFQMLYTQSYLPECVSTLRKLLALNERLVTRRVRPRIRLMTKQMSGGGSLVTCLATDFYPRHINLTLLRDGLPVDEDQLIGGSVLPNGNGLYQMRKTLMVGDKELRAKHTYTCEASHLSLGNKLEVSWRAEFSRSFRLYFILTPVGLTITTVLLSTLLCCCRRCRGSAKSQGSSLRSLATDGTDSENRPPDEVSMMEK